MIIDISSDELRQIRRGGPARRFYCASQGFTRFSALGFGPFIEQVM
jgi:hypothetical protein